MDSAVLEGCVGGYEPLIECLELPDPDDRHVLALAIRCRADAIVTFNEKDFPPKALEPFGIHTRHPDLFIRNIDEIEPGTLIKAAKQDLSHYQNLDVDAYITGLRAAGVADTADFLHQRRVMLT